MHCCLQISNITYKIQYFDLICKYTTYKLDAESTELRDLESGGPDVASRA